MRSSDCRGDEARCTHDRSPRGDSRRAGCDERERRTGELGPREWNVIRRRREQGREQHGNRERQLDDRKPEHDPATMRDAVGRERQSNSVTVWFGTSLSATVTNVPDGPDAALK